jgi:hypothetical protein
MTPEEHQAIWVQTYRLFCEDLRELTKELRTFSRVDKSSSANSPAVTTASDVGVRERNENAELQRNSS